MGKDGAPGLKLDITNRYRPDKTIYCNGELEVRSRNLGLLYWAL